MTADVHKRQGSQVLCLTRAVGLRQFYRLSTFRKTCSYFQELSDLAHVHSNPGSKLSGASVSGRMPLLFFVFVKHCVPLKLQETGFSSSPGTPNAKVVSGRNIQKKKKAISFSHKKYQLCYC